MAEEDRKQPEIEEELAQQADSQAQAAGEASVDEVPVEPAQGGQEAGEPSLEEVIAQLQDDAAAAKDMALRAQADAQNVKRRAEQDVEKARKFALERFSGELLPVVDNLERALEAAPADNEAVKPVAEGVELTLKSLLGVMSKFNIEMVDPQGEPFDPQFHQAMSMVENNEVEPNTVVAVMQKGYTLSGRLIRPAMVMVSKSGD